MAWDLVKFRLSHLAIAPSIRLGAVPSSDSRQSIARPQRKRPGAPCATEHQKTGDFIGPVGITLSLSRRPGEWLGAKSQARRAGRQR